MTAAVKHLRGMLDRALADRDALRDLAMQLRAALSEARDDVSTELARMEEKATYKWPRDLRALESQREAMRMVNAALASADRQLLAIDEKDSHGAG
ncbi:MAG TPA: hypothetical protein PLW24_07685 [Burkholderiaceae bacterium]|nr:hypothetical protein [Burkholderiaceae bacterium]